MFNIQHFSLQFKKKISHFVELILKKILVLGIF